MNGFVDMSEKEQLDIQGGIAPLVVAGLIVGGIFVAGVVVGAVVGYNQAKNDSK